MVFKQFVEKDTDGKLEGLVLLWNCAHCETNNSTWLVRKEAVFSEKHAFCTSCKGKNVVKFVSSEIMSDREKILQQALPFIPVIEQKELFEDLAWIEALFVAEGYEKIAASSWQNLESEINFWVQQDLYER